MKITCFKNHLKEKLFFAEKNAAKISNIPVLSGVYLETDKNSLKIISTNLETGFEAVIPAKIHQEGKIIIPAKIITQLINTLSDEKITLESIGQNINLSTEKISSLIKGYPLEDFPSLPKIKKSYIFTISSQELNQGLKLVCNAASNSGLKPEIASILFYIQNKNPLKLVATDSFRLAEKTLNCAVKNAESFILPIKSAVEIIKLLENKEEDIQISFNLNQINFSGKDFNFISRLIEGVFPSYESIIPKKFCTEVLIKKDQLIDAFRSASIFSSYLNEITLNIVPEDNLMEIRTKSGEIGEHTSQLNVKITGEKISLNFNYYYLLDGLQNINHSEVLLRFSGENHPLLIQFPGDSSYFYLVMPMKNT
ncbi:MAG: DNA polymerase III subunit beta [Candidatus Niyogibacteria bacterium]|nr:DNA polymerase III subunit beta [Candidatus Niyogibacteria bacterium]